MAQSAAPTKPHFEHRTDEGTVLGIGTAAPRISWFVERADQGWHQTAYEVEINRNDLATTYREASSEQVLVPWPGPPLLSRERAEVRVRVAHGDDWSAWGEPSTVEAGLLDAQDWLGRFISPVDIGAEGGRAPVVSGVLTVHGEVRRARLYATAHGIYVPTINGGRVDETVLAPGWTSYDHRLRYHVYDVTDLIVDGENTVDMLLGNGWFRGRLGYTQQRAIYGDALALLAQLEVETTDGQTHVLTTGEHWRASESHVLSDDLYDGQFTDLRLPLKGLPASRVRIVPSDLDILVAPDGPPIRPTGVLPALRVWTSPTGATLVDFGQNAVGWVRLRVRGLARGSQVVVRHAEVLEDEELGIRPLRTARATDTWFAAGEAAETLEPLLTLHGFRYVEVSGVPNLRLEDIELIVVGSDLRRAGWFASSHPLLNRLHENVVWSTRGNFVDLPTDCPQRDERLGWTGDIQVFGPTATFLFGTTGLLRSWLEDLAAEQYPDGAVPHYVPGLNYAESASPPAAAWGDAATILPWTIFQRTGDLQVLDRQLPSMRAWVDRLSSLAGPERIWQGGFQFGDWLDPTAPPEEPGRAKADPDVVATAHFARSSWIVAEAARLLGRQDEAEKYLALTNEVRAAFARTFVTPVGRVLSDAPTVYALALEWDLLPLEDQRREAGRRLADLVRASGFRISTGFVGTPLVCDALSNAGHLDVAYRLLLQTECPSWLYPVTMGATTVWERWDSMRPDGSINPGEMTSFNHYALGAVADWLHRSVAGLAPAAPGYRSLVVRPRPVAALTQASATHITPYGDASVSWERREGRFFMTVVVPVGATAEVHVPGQTTPLTVGHGKHGWDLRDPIAPNARAFDWENSSVRDLIDRADVWDLVTLAAAESGIARGGEPEVARRLAPYFDVPASRVAQALVPDEFWPGAKELHRRIAELVDDPGKPVPLAG
ncbi:glycoside hydrolase family 78 protein [Acidothermaceae bacterium B102]|nr:glycoside hydrolase family 78 protein [Acidothermaceae bacterium B102]